MSFLLNSIARNGLKLATKPFVTQSPTTLMSRSYQIAAKNIKTVKVYQPLPQKTLPANKSLISTIEDEFTATKYDTEGWKRQLLDRTNESRLKPGDIVRVHKADKTHFSGMVVGINRNGLATSVLVRNKITGLGVENRFMLFSPTVEKVYVIRKPIKAKRRAKLYYMRGSPKHDVNEVN